MTGSCALRFAVGLMLLGAVLAVTPSQAGVRLVRVAGTGDPSPDGQGTLDSVDAPVLNGRDQVGFGCVFGKSDDRHLYGLLVGTPGGLQVLVRTAGPVPGETGMEFQKVPLTPSLCLRGLSLDEAGRVLYVGAYGAAGAAFADREGLFDGGGALVLAEDPVAMLNPAIRQGDQVAFQADTGSATALVVGTPQPERSRREWTVIARRHNATPEGRTFDSPLDGDLVFDVPAFAPDGSVVFTARTHTTPTSMFDDGSREGLYLWRQGSLTKLLASGDSVEQHVVKSLNRATLGPLSVNAQGLIAVGARLEDLGDALLLVDTTGRARVALAVGTPAPDGTASITELAHAASLNDRGEVALLVKAAPKNTTGVGRGALLAGPPEALRTICYEGEPAPAGGIIKSLLMGGAYSAGDRPNLNRSGQLAFLATIGPADTLGYASRDDVTALLRWNSGQLEEIVRTGQSLEGRTVEGVAFYNSAAPGRSALNDLGTVAFAVSFTDHSSSVYLAPGPSDPIGETAPGVPGDVDGNGSLTIADVLTVLRAAVGIAPLSPDQLQSLRRLHPGAGDHADISDVLALLRAVLGMGG